jgi:hypothetical protein
MNCQKLAPKKEEHLLEAVRFVCTIGLLSTEARFMETKEFTNNDLNLKDRFPSPLSYFGWVLGALSILNLIDDLKLINIREELKKWIDSYSDIIEEIGDFVRLERLIPERPVGQHMVTSAMRRCRTK